MLDVPVRIKVPWPFLLSWEPFRAPIASRLPAVTVLPALLIFTVVVPWVQVNEPTDTFPLLTFKVVAVLAALAIVPNPKVYPLLPVTFTVWPPIFNDPGRVMV